jgi:hypothetical protein
MVVPTRDSDLFPKRTSRSSFYHLVALLFFCQLPVQAQTTFTDAEIDEISTLVHHHFDNQSAAMVVGLVDEQRTRIITADKLDNGTDAAPDGDTLFVIGSCTKTFTVLLLADMAERGAGAGLSAGLIVQSIDGIPTRGKTLPQCLALLRGPVETKVRLKILDPQNQTSSVELTRRSFLTS